MIHVRVGPCHLLAVTGVSPAFDAALQDVCPALHEKPYLSAAKPKELGKATVYDVLQQFHRELTKTLIDRHPNAVEQFRKTIEEVGRDIYHRADFCVESEDACELLAVHKVAAHGTIQKMAAHGKVQRDLALPPTIGPHRSEAVFLPDLSHGATLFGAIGSSEDIKFILFDYLIDWKREHLATIECHVCDTLDVVFKREQAVLSSKRRELPPAENAVTILNIDGIPAAFRGYRSLLRRAVGVPVIGNHRLLCASAIRRGLAARIVSDVFPSELWRAIGSNAVHEFLLEAAELACKHHVTVLYPNVPDAEEMTDVCRLGFSQLGTVEGFGSMACLTNPGEQFDDMSRHAEKHRYSLEQLGLYPAVPDGIKRYREACEGREYSGWALDWSFALDEVKGALLDGSVMQSLRMKETFDLYPLHKRVLGLVEYIILPEIEQKFRTRDGKLPDMAKGASGLWTAAFTGAQDFEWDKQVRKRRVTKNYEPLIKFPRSTSWQTTWESDGKKATLETEGNWLLAASHPGLSELLDEIVARMSSAPEVHGLSISFSPTDPRDHAKQLAVLGDGRNPKAAYMTLYLGKLAVMLRNAVEHGTDEVERDGLRVDASGYWNEERRYKGNLIQVLDWDQKTAAEVRWRESLPATLPSAANAFVLTPASLHRCLVLMSLVLHGAFNQLCI